MRLDIFDVEHGACALVTADDGTRVMIDAGHNATTGWRPGSYLRSMGVGEIRALIITNYDEDHVSGLNDLLDNVSVSWLYRNRSVPPGTIRLLKTEDGMGPGIARLVQAAESVFTITGSAPPTPGLDWWMFHADYPTFEDENNLSSAVFLDCKGVGVLFTGDLEVAAWLELLKRADFRAALSRTQVFVASHHGRESGYCAEVFDYCSPTFVVISDKGYMYDTQKMVPFYRQHTGGGAFRGATRHVLTTRNDGTISFVMTDTGWSVG